MRVNGDAVAVQEACSSALGAGSVASEAATGTGSSTACCVATPKRASGEGAEVTGRFRPWNITRIECRNSGFPSQDRRESGAWSPPHRAEGSARSGMTRTRRADVRPSSDEPPLIGDGGVGPRDRRTGRTGTLQSRGSCGPSLCSIRNSVRHLSSDRRGQKAQERPQKDGIGSRMLVVAIIDLVRECPRLRRTTLRPRGSVNIVLLPAYARLWLICTDLRSCHLGCSWWKGVNWPRAAMGIASGPPHG